MRKVILFFMVLVSVTSFIPGYLWFFNVNFNGISNEQRMWGALFGLMLAAFIPAMSDL